MARRTGIEPVIMVRQTIVITASLTPDMELHDGAAPPSSAYKADVIAGILMEHLVETRASQHAANLNMDASCI